MEAVKKISYKGMTIEIYHDENAESPDDCGNEDCFIIYSHRSFSVQVDGFDDEEKHENKSSGRVPPAGFLPHI